MHARRLRKAVKERPEATLEELAELIDFDVDPSVMHRTLERLTITRKRKVNQASERDDERGGVNSHQRALTRHQSR